MTAPSLALEILARALVVLAAAGLAHALLRRGSASVRAGIWTTALAGLLILPAMSRLLPAWRIEVLKPIAAAAAEPTGLVETLPVRTFSTGAMTIATPALDVSTSPAVLPSIVPNAYVASPRPAIRPWWILLAVWIGVAAMLIARIVTSHIRLALIARRPEPSNDAELDAEIQRARARLGIMRDVAWRTTDDVSVPAVTGFRRATLLLPADAASWPPDLKRSVVAHELAHVARWDAAGQLIGQVACAAYWFVPFVWFGARRAAVLREQACDDAVLQSGVVASTYASNLILLAQQAGAAPTAAAALPMASPHIQERVMAILDPSVRRHAVTLRAAVALVFAGAGVVAAAATVEPTHRAALAEAEATPVAYTADFTAEAPQPAAPMKQAASSRATAPVRQAPAQSTSRICGDDLDKSSSSIRDDNGVRTWTIKLKGPRCTVDLQLDGKVEFNDAFTDIASISSGGFLRLDVTDNGVRRQLELQPRGGSLERTWRVDGRERPYDDDAKSWFAAFLIEIDRRTAVGVDHRLKRLLRQGGVNAVLDETNLMRSDYARGVYYQKLAGATRLSAGDVGRIIKQAAALKTSDFYATELLKNFAKLSDDDAATRAAMFELILALQSDFYQTEAVKAVLGRVRPNAADMDLLVGMVPRIESNFYKTEMLGQVLKAGMLDAKQRATLARAAPGIQEDFYAAQFIQSLAASGDFDSAGTKSLIDAASGIKSDFYLSEAFATLTSKVALTESDLLMMVERVRKVPSDFYAAETLRRLAAHKSATARVRQAIADAARALSSFYRDEVLRVSGIKG